MEGAPRASRRGSSCYEAAPVGLGGNVRPGALLMREAGRLSLRSCHAPDLKDVLAGSGPKAGQLIVFSSAGRQLRVWLFRFE
jgi:hypothetical protein